MGVTDLQILATWIIVSADDFQGPIFDSPHVPDVIDCLHHWCIDLDYCRSADKFDQTQAATLYETILQERDNNFSLQWYELELPERVVIFTPIDKYLDQLKSDTADDQFFTINYDDLKVSPEWHKKLYNLDYNPKVHLIIKTTSE